MKIQTVYDDGRTWEGVTETRLADLSAALMSIEPNGLIYRALTPHGRILREWIRGRRGWVEVVPLPDSSRPWACVLEHEHGMDVTLHDTESEAMRTSASFALAWFVEEFGRDFEPEELDELTDEQKVEYYWEHIGRESSTVTQVMQ